MMMSSPMMSSPKTPVPTSEHITKQREIADKLRKLPSTPFELSCTCRPGAALVHVCGCMLAMLRCLFCCNANPANSATTDSSSGNGKYRQASLIIHKEDIEDERGAPDRCIIVPVPGHWKEKWDLLVMVLIIYSAVMVPVRVCFDADAEGAAWAFEASMSLVFMVDLIITFRTAYIEDGEWIKSGNKIGFAYLTGWFWIDAPSSIPVEIIVRQHRSCECSLTASCPL